MSYLNQSDLYLEDNISKYPAIELLCKMGYKLVICVLLLGSYTDAVYFAWYVMVLTESSLTYDFLVKGRRKREWPVCTAEAVHFRQLHIA